MYSATVSKSAGSHEREDLTETCAVKWPPVLTKGVGYEIAAFKLGQLFDKGVLTSALKASGYWRRWSSIKLWPSF